ncbi:MAG: hypothetical protein RL404_1571 [Pseudomonadota bacterium]|jgi:uncharacterized protein (TIGR00251 family)
MSRDWCSRHGDGLRIAVHVQPNASASGVAGEVDGALRLKLKAPPIDGKANEALVKLLAGLLGVTKRDVQVTHGLTGRQKLVLVKTAMTVDEARAVLLAAPR